MTAQTEKSGDQSSSALKLKEAEFFLELLVALDDRKKALTWTGDTALEASFLFSAILNSFYSAYVIMRDEEKINISELTKNFPDIYAHGTQGGERAKTVHIKHTLPAKSGYVPPVKVVMNLRRTPVLIDESREKGGLTLNLGPNHYMYIERRDELVDVVEYCSRHLCELKAFHAKMSKPYGAST